MSMAATGSARSSRSVWRRATVAGAAALVINLLILAAARLAEVPLTIPAFDGVGTLTIGVGAVVAMSLVPYALGAALAAVVVPRSGRGTVILAVTGGVLAIASLVPPLTLDAATATRLTLASMHLPVALAYLAVVVPALRSPSSDGASRARSASTTSDVQVH